MFVKRPGWCDEPARAENTWNAEPLHYGFKKRPSPGQPPEANTDKWRNPVAVNLAQDGTVLPDGDPYIHLNFHRHSQTDFNALSLGPFA